MAGDSAEDRAASGPIPEATALWLDERAADLGLSREEFVRRLVAAYHAVAERDEPPAAAEDVDALEEEVADLDRELDEKIRDVRQRVIQVKQETDGKAPEGHDHPDLREKAVAAATRAERVERDIAEVASDVEALDDRLADVEARVDAGFENYEEVLEYLTETTDDLSGKLDTLARAVVEMRTAARTLAGRAEARAAVDELKAEANRLGVRSAACGECDESVDVALLTEPACPACASTFSDVEPKQRLFGSPTLVVGDLPALEPGDHPGIDAETLLEGDTDLNPIIDD
jgi:chromosome segregation ATPase